MARVMTSKEIEGEFGVSAELIGQWADDAEKGIYHGGERGKVVRGRPLMFGEETRQVGFKEPLGKVEAIDKQAKQLGMKRSDYLRHLVDEDLKLAGIA